MTMVRVLIVDDQLPFRRAAQAVVESTDTFVVVGAFETAEQGLAAVDELRPQLILMDVNLPGIDGVEASRRLRARHPDIVVILLSSYDEAEFADLTSDCGAAAYVPKSAFGPDRLEEVWAAIASRESADRRSGIGAGRRICSPSGMSARIDVPESAHPDLTVQRGHPIPGVQPDVGPVADPNPTSGRPRGPRSPADTVTTSRSSVDPQRDDRLADRSARRRCRTGRRRPRPPGRAADRPSPSTCSSANGWAASNWADSAGTRPRRSNNAGNTPRQTVRSSSSACSVSPISSPACSQAGPVRSRVPGRRLVQGPLDRSEVRHDAAPDRRRQPLPGLVLDAQQPPAGCRELDGLGFDVPHPAGQFGLQQRVAEGHPGLCCDVLEQVSFEVPQLPTWRRADLDAADLFAHVQHRKRRVSSRIHARDRLPAAPCRSRPGCAAHGEPRRPVHPAGHRVRDAPTARPVASATRAGRASGDGLSASRRLSEASASYGAARLP